MIYLYCDLPVSPPRTHHTHHDIPDTYICQIFILWERKFVKSSTLLRLKTRLLSRWNPGKFDPKFQETRSPMRYDISIFFCGWHRKILASGSLAARPGPFYYPKIGFLEYLRTSGEILYPNGPIGYWKSPVHENGVLCTKVSSGGKPLYRSLDVWTGHTEVCRKYTKVSARGTPVHFRGNISKKLSTHLFKFSLESP